MQLVYLHLGLKPQWIYCTLNLIIYCLKGARCTDLQLHYHYLKLFFIIVLQLWFRLRNICVTDCRLGEKQAGGGFNWMRGWATFVKWLETIFEWMTLIELTEKAGWNSEKSNHYIFHSVFNEFKTNWSLFKRRIQINRFIVIESFKVHKTPKQVMFKSLYWLCKNIIYIITVSNQLKTQKSNLSQDYIKNHQCICSNIVINVTVPVVKKMYAK